MSKTEVILSQDNSDIKWSALQLPSRILQHVMTSHGSFEPHETTELANHVRQLSNHIRSFNQSSETINQSREIIHQPREVTMQLHEMINLSCETVNQSCATLNQSHETISQSRETIEQCWARVTFFSSRHRHVRHWGVFSANLAPPRHI